MRRRREALVSMVGGAIYAVTPPNAFKVKRGLEIHGDFISVVIFFDQGYRSKFTIIEIMF